MTKVLFILKRKEDYNIERDGTSIGLSTGLYNSANYMNEMLSRNCIESNLVVVTDNNDIDREVTKYRPDYVIIEALWVVPSKFEILSKLHPKVKWVIRVHSEMPFLAGEGSAISWISEYSKLDNVILGINAPRMFEELTEYLRFLNSWSKLETSKKLVYLPNYYPIDFLAPSSISYGRTIDIGCFGAIRPLKNQLSQAFAAIEFANKLNRKLNFHINSNRIEMQGSPVLHNIKALFAQVEDKGHVLVHHEWSPREQFVELCSQMDIGMQVSFSETFNIVGADIISQGVPLVGCKEIPWQQEGIADPTNISSMVRELFDAYDRPKHNVHVNQRSLHEYSCKTEHIWVSYFSKPRFEFLKNLKSYFG